VTSRWDTKTLAACADVSRRLGADPTLVLHGGGNSSVKTGWHDITGQTIDAIFVKGTGRNMVTLEPEGFSPLRLGRLRELLKLETLADDEMARELSAARLDPNAPQPSVEALLHAFLPAP
jgi:rhamnose utilization protein RhaD (predicted bifunctional aldolase and dehydrogenase)